MCTSSSHTMQEQLNQGKGKTEKKKNQTNMDGIMIFTPIYVLEIENWHDKLMAFQLKNSFSLTHFLIPGHLEQVKCCQYYCFHEFANITREVCTEK